MQRTLTDPVMSSCVRWALALAALLGALDHPVHGVTCVFNFSYNARVGEYGKPQVQGLLDSRMRFVHGFAQNRSIPIEEQYQTFLRYYDFAKSYLNDPRFLRVGI